MSTHRSFMYWIFDHPNDLLLTLGGPTETLESKYTTPTETLRAPTEVLFNGFLTIKTSSH